MSYVAFSGVTSNPSAGNQVLLIHGDSDYADYSGTGKVITSFGGANFSTSQSIFGGGSLYFDGTNDYFTTPDHADFNFGSSNFSVDFRLRMTAAPNTDQPLVCQWVDPNNRGWYIGTGVTSGNSGVIKFLCSNDGVAVSVITTSPTVIPLNTWVHVAVWRLGTNIYITFDGVFATIAPMPIATIFNSTAAIGIGALGSGSAICKSQYLEEIRVCKAPIGYGTTGFTPPTSAY